MPSKEIKPYAELQAESNLNLSERMEMLVQHQQALDKQSAQLQAHKIKSDEKIEFYRNDIDRANTRGAE